jgi:hypothetical protein
MTLLNRPLCLRDFRHRWQHPFRQNLTANDSYSYRVWADTSGKFIPHDGPQGTAASPHPTGFPDGFQPFLTTPSLVTLQNSPFSRNDPWLPAGAVETFGNNVEAYADLVSPDGFQPQRGDFRGSSNGVKRSITPSFLPPIDQSADGISGSVVL